MKEVGSVLLTVLLISTLTYAQAYKGQGRINGVVTDDQGNPLEGVKIKLYLERVKSGLETETDKDGEWKAWWIRGGTWKIDFEKPSYVPHKLDAEVDEWKKNPPILVTMKKVEGAVLTEELVEALNEGNELYDQMKYAEAISSYQKILEKLPDAHIINKNIGNTYTNRSESEKASEWYQKIDFETISDPTVLYNIGSNFYSSKKYEDALKYYKRAIEIKTDFLDALYLLGLVHLALANHQDSIHVFENYLEKDPDSERSDQVRDFIEFLKTKIKE